MRTHHVIRLVALASVFGAGCATVPPNKAGAGDRHEPVPGIHATDIAAMTADQALARLREGNARFAAGTSSTAAIAAGRSIARVHQTGTEGQKPFAAVLTCADSRTPPEIFLDQGVGDLFVVRVAGNVTDTMGLASLEYGVDHLGVPLIVVLGHTRCGAVDAAVHASEAASGAHAPNEAHVNADDAPGNLGELVAAIEPAVAAARASGQTPLLLASIRANVRQSMAQLASRSPVLAREIKAGDVRVVGAIYDVSTGAIEWLPPQ